jgi:hypothetical protein
VPLPRRRPAYKASACCRLPTLAHPHTYTHAHVRSFVCGRPHAPHTRTHTQAARARTHPTHTAHDTHRYHTHTPHHAHTDPPHTCDTLRKCDGHPCAVYVAPGRLFVRIRPLCGGPSKGALGTCFATVLANALPVFGRACGSRLYSTRALIGAVWHTLMGRPGGCDATDDLLRVRTRKPRAPNRPIWAQQ